MGSLGKQDIIVVSFIYIIFLHIMNQCESLTSSDATSHALNVLASQIKELLRSIYQFPYILILRNNIGV